MVDGMSTREASRVFGLHRDTVRKMLAYSVPPGYRRRQPPRRPKIGPTPIDRILTRMTSTCRSHRQAHLRPARFGTRSSRTTSEHRRRTREMFVPLVHPPGHAQCDFGEALAVILGLLRRTCPTARDVRESFCDCVSASRSLEEFEHRVTTPVWPLPGYWETVVADAHECSQSFSRTTCSRTGSDVPARATTRARWRVWSDSPGGTSWCPYPRSRASSSQRPPRGASLERMEAKLRGHTETKASAWWVISTHCRQCRMTRATDLTRVSSLSLVRSNDYSVPVAYGHSRGYVDEVVVSCGADVIARHRRSYDRDDFVFDPIHYLPLLERKTGALDQAAPLAGWDLPEVRYPAPAAGVADGQTRQERVRTGAQAHGDVQYRGGPPGGAGRDQAGSAELRRGQTPRTVRHRG